MRNIKKIFIANRGEICRRIALTAKRMGIETSCVSERKAPPSFLLGIIDDFIFVEEESVALYLDAASMVSFAKKIGADALHPGYGFLSENEFFAQSVLDAKLIWIGPSPSAIKAMAHKSEARQLAQQLSVPCIEGISVPSDVKEKTLVDLAKKVTYPILLKAAKGGGGKGMRIVESPSELWEKAQQAFSEAQNYFGEGTLLIERFLSQSRHIEVQILGDQQGHLVTLGDRDCSLQRRYQKIVEESPALGLTQKTRDELYRCALLLSREVGYSSCGTVEFLVDWSEASRKKETQDFFFLEMNTRLQVEHPVTEAVFGLDLVEWQIRVACGEKLSEDLNNIKPRGHAIEARIYAEDPSQNFFPSPGKVYCFLPAQGPFVRWDLGIDTVDEIRSKFDPMFAKLTVSGESRQLALQRMIEILNQTFFAGPINNLGFLQEIFLNPEFQQGPVDTNFLKKVSFTQSSDDESLEDILLELQKRGGSFQSDDFGRQEDIHKKTQSIFSLQNTPVQASSQTVQVTYELNRIFSLELPFKITYGQASKVYETGRFISFFYACAKQGGAQYYYIKSRDRVLRREVKEKRAVHTAVGVQKKQDQILAPVPGRVLKVLVQEQDSVEDKQSLFILDSMKMEFVISSEGSGIIQTLKVREGDQVESGQLLADFKVH
jgi:acetyl/propionyl-CoA carboxylase alpha subunit